MRLLITLVAILVVAGFLWVLVLGANAFMARRQSPDHLSRGDRHELDSLRELFHDLAVEASEHATLGDHFAVIALQRINTHRKTLNPNQRKKLS